MRPRPTNKTDEQVKDLIDFLSTVKGYDLGLAMARKMLFRGSCRNVGSNRRRKT